MIKSKLNKFVIASVCVLSFGFVASLHAVTPVTTSTTKTTTTTTNANASQNIVQVAQSNPNFSTLVNLLVAADLVNTLEGQGPFTVFAPTNAAFAKLPPQVLQDLAKPENKDKLIAILKYHVIPGKVTSKDVRTMTAKSVNGKDIDVKAQGGDVTLNGTAKVVKADIQASNGVIHVIDTVLIPKN